MPENSVVVLGSRGIPARYGGFETLVENLRYRISKTGIRVVVPSNSAVNSYLPSVIAKYLDGVLNTWRSYWKLDMPSSSRVLLLNPINFPLAILLDRRNITVVLHMDGRDDKRAKWPWFVRVIYRIMYRLILRSRFTIIFDSDAVRKELSPSFSINHVLISYGGCEYCSDRPQVWSRVSIRNNFLVLARAEPENQIIQIVKAISRTREPSQLQLVVSTRIRGKYWNQLMRVIGTVNSVNLIEGIWEKDKLCAIYRDVSAVVHGHTVGGTNPSLVLALCHGTPVLAHDNPYNREVAGPLARYWKTEQELTKLLDEFDPVTWPYDQAAVDDFNRRYNWDDVVEKYKRVLGLDQSSSGGQSNGQ